MSNSLTRIIKEPLAFIFENIWWKLLSLAAAAVIWALVATEPELSAFATTPVEYKNLPDGLEIDSNPVTTVQLELRGPSFALRNLNDPTLQPQVILDMSGAEPGPHTFVIGDGAVKLPRGVHLVRAIPAQARFAFDRRATRTIPVAITLVGAGNNGYVVAGQQAQPATLAIVGPASHVSRILQANTDPVDVSGVTGDADFHVNAFLNDPYVRFESSPQVDVTVTMKKK